MEKDVIFQNKVYTYDELLEYSKDMLIFMLRLSCENNFSLQRELASRERDLEFANKHASEWEELSHKLEKYI